MSSFFEDLFCDENMSAAPFITDYIIQSKRPVWVRINRKWQEHPQYCTRPSEEMVRDLIHGAQNADVVPSLPVESSEAFAVGGRKFAQKDFSFEISDLEHGLFRYRVHLSNELRGIEVNVRVLRSGRIEAQQLGFETSLIDELLRRPTGVIVVAGKTGTGKSTTLAALVRAIAERHPERRLITAEKPIEYPFDDLSTIHVSQRQVGIHIPDFKTGILNIKRESADFALIGEIQEESEIQGVFEAAASGHLVLTTCHAETVPKALDFLNRGGADMNLRMATYLNAVIVQELIPSCDPNGNSPYRYPSLAYEVMINSPDHIAMTSSLRKGEWSALTLSSAEGQYPMSRRLDELVSQREITRQEADKVRRPQ